MPKLRRLITACLLILPLLTACLGAPVFGFGARRHDIRRVHIDIDLLSGGQAEIVEQYEITSETGMRRFQLDVVAPLQGRITDFTIDAAKAESDLAPALFTKILRYDATSDEGRAPYSYEISSPSAERQTLNITGQFDPGRWIIRISYTLANTVLQTEDTAIFRLRFFPSRKAGMQTGTMSLTLPQPLQNSEYQLLFVSETPVQFTFDEVQTFRISAGALSQSDDARLFLTLPASVFAELDASSDTRTAAEQIDAAVLASERALARGTMTTRLSAVQPIWFLAALLFWILYYLRFEREGMMRGPGPDYALWPSRVPPLAVAQILGKKKLGPLILSTLLRLTNRRTLKMEGYVFTWRHPDRVDYSRYSSFEVFLLHWFLGEITNGDPAASAIQVKNYKRNKKNASRFADSVRQMETELKRSFDNMRLLDRRKSWYAGLLGLIFGIAIVLTALTMIFLTGTAAAYLLLLPGLLFIWSSRGLKHLNEEGLKHRTEARMYRDKLDTMSHIFKSCSSHYTEIETAIIALPRAVALNKTDVFMDGLKQFSKRRYIILAQVLLKIYDSQEPPSTYDRDEEYERCLREMDSLKETLITSLSILNQVFG